MTEFELAYIVDETTNTLYGFYEMWLSITFAMVIGSHYAGNQLPRAVIHLLVFMYACIVVSSALEMLSVSQTLEIYLERLAEIERAAQIEPSIFKDQFSGWIYMAVDASLNIVAFAAGSIGVIVFAYYASNPKYRLDAKQ